MRSAPRFYADWCVFNAASAYYGAEKNVRRFSFFLNLLIIRLFSSLASPLPSPLLLSHSFVSVTVLAWILISLLGQLWTWFNILFWPIRNTSWARPISSRGARIALVLRGRRRSRSRRVEAPSRRRRWAPCVQRHVHGYLESLTVNHAVTDLIGDWVPEYSWHVKSPGK